MPHRENKIIIEGDAARKGIQEGARKTYSSVKATFGPMSSNVGIQKNWGLGRITHDGVTVAREIHLRDDAENFGAEHLAEASKQTNNAAGDGTSATVILGYHILNLANRQVFSGRNPMQMKRGIRRAAKDAVAIIDELKTPIDIETDEGKAKLIQVATISASGDAAMGQLIADTVGKVGKGVTIEEYPGMNVEREIVEGFHYDSGWASPHLSQIIQAEEDGANPVSVLVTDKHITKLEDIFPLMQILVKANRSKLIVVGKVTGSGLGVAVSNVRESAGSFEMAISESPIYGQQRVEFLQDVATFTGAKLVANPRTATLADLGKATKVVLTQKATTIFGGQGDPEQIASRISDIKAKLKKETVDVVRMHMENRLAKLTGRVGVIYVGGATETEVKEKKDRVDDAVHATQCALEDGIVPGGGTTLVEVARRLEHLPHQSKRAGAVTMHPDELEGYRVVIEAFRMPFQVLMQNSGQPAEYNLEMLKEAGYGFAYDAEHPTKKPVDVWEAGVLDPAKVIKLEVENGCSIAGELVTTETVIAHEDLSKVEQIEDQDV